MKKEKEEKYENYPVIREKMWSIKKRRGGSDGDRITEEKE